MNWKQFHADQPIEGGLLFLSNEEPELIDSQGKLLWAVFQKFFYNLKTIDPPDRSFVCYHEEIKSSLVSSRSLSKYVCAELHATDHC